jgi:hypothetical protein
MFLSPVPYFEQIAFPADGTPARSPRQARTTEAPRSAAARTSAVCKRKSRIATSMIQASMRTWRKSEKLVSERVNKRKRMTYDTRHCEKCSDAAIQTASWTATGLRPSQ